MPTDVERLIVSLEASTTKYERALAKANGETDRRVRAMQARFDGFGSNIARTQSSIAGSLAIVGRAFGVLGIALTTASIIAMTSAWTDLNSRISNAAGGVERGAAVLDRLSEMARRTYSSLQQTAEGYLQNQQALSALGYSTEQQLDLVETLNNSLVVSAVRGQRAQSVMEAWSKAMASGSLRGDNLNTIIQSSGRLSKALADSMGISVNELRRWGEQGKITTDVMFGVTSQLDALRAEANAMPATVADGMVLLGDAVMQFVGEADKAAGSSSVLAEAIVRLSDAIKDSTDEPWFDKVFGAAGDATGQKIFELSAHINNLTDAMDYLSQTSPADAILDLNAAMGGSVRTAEEFELALADAEQAVAALALNTEGKFNTVIKETSDGVVTLGDAVQDLFQQALEARGSAAKAEEAIRSLGSVGDADFAALQGTISAVIANLYAMRDAANAAHQAAANTTTDLGSFPTSLDMETAFSKPVTERPPGPGGGGKSPTEKFSDDLTQYARKIEMLRQETALTAALNPLLNDYGYAKERLKAVQELENAAVKAGLALGPEQRRQIETLAEGYARATAEASMLAEAQDLARQGAEDLAQAGRAALDTIIDGFLEGKDAGEVLNSVFKDLGRSLINMGLNAIGGGMGKGGFNLFSLLGFASGTANTGGRRGEPRGVVHGQEAVIPLPSGGRVPVDLRMPGIPAAQPMAMHVTWGIATDGEGNITPYIEKVVQSNIRTAAPSIVGTAVKQANASAPTALAKYQNDVAGGDYRV